MFFSNKFFQLVWLASFIIFCPLKVLAQQVYYLQSDHLGSTQIVTDINKKIIELIDYYVFGQLRFDKSANNFKEHRKFISQEYDQTGLNYLQARYYQSSLGKFISQDSEFWNLPNNYLIDPQQQNSYAYARDNPVIYLDPFGLSSATWQPIPSGGWHFGQAMGQFNGVVAYYNGLGSSQTTYSCVEYAKRYQSQVYGINNIGPVKDAKTMWTMVNQINERLSQAKVNYFYTQYNNGTSLVLPQAGDLLFWTEGKYGHVMVATEARFDETTNKGYVEIIDQNASRQAVRKLDVKKTTQGYMVMKNESTPLAGWFRPTETKSSLDDRSTSPAAPKAQTTSSSLWSKIKQFFKKYF